MRILRPVDVIVRYRNHASFLPETLLSLTKQKISLRVIGIDSGSTDGSRSLVEAAGGKVLDLPPADFSYGRALNLGMRVARSDVVIVLSAHVVVGEGCLDHLVAGCEDSSIAGAYGRLIPGSTMNPFESRNMASYYGDIPRIQRESTRFTNSLSAIKRQVWTAEPFDETLPAAEDQEWVGRAQRRGYSVAYVPSASAHYYQEFGVSGIYKRAVKLGYAHQVMQPGRAPRLIGCLASAAGWTLADIRSCARGEISLQWGFVSPFFRLRQEFGLYIGASRAFRIARTNNR